MDIVTPADLGTLVRNSRRERGLTQADLADLAYISRDTVIRIEQGHPRIEIGKALAALAALELALASTSSPHVGGPQQASLAVLDSVFAALHQGD
ncbi:transcriptional regulator, y4mF family [Aeromicrobium marinum DSM 15272]|uniref:Transcriptional regulator, y4mF family n=1 Tax=Aeromicrobium marinum DSM 15272 TaxID=585531 RepID=E2S7Y4_9ACTN|nr:helix-turn-helix domain-containing protein [Aeromicrobium marinum]EFQ84800.1 transcriptional regulator, y4mF family [Aeromicrobium marinum DSM 15272]